MVYSVTHIWSGGAALSSYVNVHNYPLLSFSVNQATFVTRAATPTLTSSYDDKTYNPFNSDIYRLIPYVSTLFILITLLWSAIRPACKWLPTWLTNCFNTLSPFITELDLKVERGQDEKSFLRRGAISKQDEQYTEYSMEGFERQASRNAIIAGLSLLETVAWISVTGWTFSYNDTIYTETIPSFSVFFTWVSEFPLCQMERCI